LQAHCVGEQRAQFFGGFVKRCMRMLARAAQGAPEKEDAVWGFTR